MPGSWVVSAEGEERIGRAVVHTPRGTRILPCEYLAVAFGLWPNAELAQYLGCAAIDNAVAVDDFQRTSVAGIYCAGECDGHRRRWIRRLPKGRLRVMRRVDETDLARGRFGARTAGRRFAARAEGSGCTAAGTARSAAGLGTIVCRCEDVRCAALQNRESWRAAKLHLRCGMGPCQGRVCGPAAQWLFGWTVESIQPPIFPRAHWQSAA